MNGEWDYCVPEPAIVLAAWVVRNERGHVESVQNGVWYSYVVFPYRTRLHKAITP